MAWEAVSPIFGPIVETAEKVRVKEEPIRITLPEEESNTFEESDLSEEVEELQETS